jgi:hypothetical protein
MSRMIGQNQIMVLCIKRLLNPAIHPYNNLRINSFPFRFSACKYTEYGLIPERLRHADMKPEINPFLPVFTPETAIIKWFPVILTMHSILDPFHRYRLDYPEVFQHIQHFSDPLVQLMHLHNESLQPVAAS